MHQIYRIQTVEVIAPYTLRLTFDDGAEQTIDLEPVLRGEIYGPLRGEELFNQVTIDPEVHTVVWPNGADFDPETLHDWPMYADALAERAKDWETRAA